MAIAITSSPGYLQPVYSIQEYTLYDSGNYSETDFYYQLDVSINGETRTVKLYKDENNKAVVDVQAILQPFITSEFLTVPTDNLITANFDYVSDYQVRASSYWSGGSSVGSWQTAKKIFNGVDQYDRTWDASLYGFKVDASSLFMVADHSPRDIHLNDTEYLVTYWDYGNFDTSFNGMSYTRYNYDGDVSTYTWPWPLQDYGFDVPVRIYIDASIINYRNGSEFISADTEYFTVQSLNGLSETIRYNIIPEQSRYERYYRIYYIDSLGATAAFNFDLVPEDNINISRTTYISNRSRKAYNTKVEENLLVRSDWICEAKSNALKDLWTTPKAGLAREWGIAPYDIVLNESSKQILNRHNQGLINYTLNFSYANELYVQMQ